MFEYNRYDFFLFLDFGSISNQGVFQPQTLPPPMHGVPFLLSCVDFYRDNKKKSRKVSYPIPYTTALLPCSHIILCTAIIDLGLCATNQCVIRETRGNGEKFRPNKSPDTNRLFWWLVLHSLEY